ncbi:alpha-tubulin N-acetyltransferase 1 isoform X1 [Drosophila pseudoobscura]|uniref:Alpha-tubulin N-acetyltransferase n=1 Tax=Drosophila pseudoobscura pseudoobscura TaxID=46245 RepID=A0A6I8VJ96_DROPS|nr:alpha-tubulin N-acetyltransferase 1 isoform X1 [Drosophila pseudoobscura]XP_015042477.2 alpha-tubulin N-acetyltransferase 1 isoform X1 [Drosophila pseudoobscura]XP_015042478.2 alpha-tubulin N-acetyltransferase 1 isoform X1 [Drosophila pseudoobscura]XP_033240629.1 alpha-tubulin N-acetyltransferase 1 isoform X1 [Drosophila pseudoobscura]XP_033240630.1 alpha-tubulin N-acetyltransferase 1 isoform X1 [Drosophila pseudoobscura]
MADFRFDIRPLFPEPIVRVTSNLLPHTFRGDRRQCLDATSKMSEIIDRLGELSATSQGLSKPVTTAQRLRMSENQTIYLLADTEAGHNGAVTGLLKVGNKDLYLFDEAGQTRKVERAPSILDFYVHESRQRTGLGKRLFETMLREENWTPLKCSVDRPSEKLLAFFGKHYGLVRTIPQSNNFVLYEGYFNEANSSSGHAHAQSSQEAKNELHITNSPNTQLFGATYLGEEVNHRRHGSQQQKQTPNVLLQQITQISPNGRYGARHPTCTMAEIISGISKVSTKGAGGTGNGESSSGGHADGNNIAEEMTAQMDLHHLEDQQQAHGHMNTKRMDLQEVADQEEAHFIRYGLPPQIDSQPEFEPEPEPLTPPSPPEVAESIIGENRRPAGFHLSKQHTGMKNRSSGVGMAVMPTSKMEFNQEEREDFGVVKINRPPGHNGHSLGHDNTDAVSTVSSGNGGHLTNEGYNDLKFYHNRLW